LTTQLDKKFLNSEIYFYLTLKICYIELPCENFTTPCSGHGACYDLSETEYICVCNAGYNGTDCDVDINECDSNPCFHGNCTDEMNHFSCVCYDGYEGVQCQTGILILFKTY